MAENKELTPEQELEQLRKEKAAWDKERAEQEKLIQEQNERLDLAEAQKGKSLPVISHKKQKYQVLAAKFKIGNEEYKAEELQKADNSKLIDTLIEKKSGLLQLIK
ncbi:MAG: hypothetical protein LPK01_04015 [Hymenobacteraceae bacterium]|nr:hypothetical protein [Hymenobacteraceae bacterium]